MGWGSKKILRVDLQGVGMSSLQGCVELSFLWNFDSVSSKLLWRGQRDAREIFLCVLILILLFLFGFVWRCYCDQ